MEPHSYDKAVIEEQHEMISAALEGLGRIMVDHSVNRVTKIEKIREIARLIVTNFRQEDTILLRLHHRKYLEHKHDHDFIIKILANVVLLVSEGTLLPSEDIAIQIAACLTAHNRDHDNDLLEMLSHSIWSMEPPRDNGATRHQH